MTMSRRSVGDDVAENAERMIDDGGTDGTEKTTIDSDDGDGGERSAFSNSTARDGDGDDRCVGRIGKEIVVGDGRATME